MANKIKLTRGTKANIEANKSSLEPYQIVYATDTSEIGVKKANGDVDYFPANDTNQVYGGKNLVMPDLTGKEYLGDGVYRLYDDSGITIDYEVNSGIFTINGTTNSNLGLKLGTTWLPNGNYYRTFYYISGTKTYHFAIWALGESYPFDLYMGTTNLYNSQIITDTTSNNRKNTIYLYLEGGATYDNYQFKLQIEKGTTATPYTLPMYVTPELLDTKVDKETGKGLSTNDYTTTEKNKLAGIEAGAQVNPYSKTELDNKFNDKVDKVTGKGLSTNDFTDEDKAKINTLETSKQDKLVAGDNITIDENTNVISASGGEVDLNAMSYFNYASSVYSDKYSLLVDAWEHSLTVDPEEISVNSSPLSPRGKAQYPNGETEGVIIPNIVTSIGSSAFFNWSSNNQPLIIPNSVTSIGSNAFADWTSNNQPLVIPNSVTSIGEWAFAGWFLVPYVEIKAITPPTLANTNAFEAQNNAPIYVPDESVDDYKTATNWVSLASRIFPISAKVVSGVRIPLDNQGKISFADLKYITENISNTFFVDMNYADDDIGKIMIRYGTQEIAQVEVATFIKIRVDDEYGIVITNLGNVNRYNSIDPQELEYIHFNGIEPVVVTAVKTY